MFSKVPVFSADSFNSVSVQCTHGKSSIAQKPEDHPKVVKC